MEASQDTKKTDGIHEDLRDARSPRGGRRSAGADEAASSCARALPPLAAIHSGLSEERLLQTLLDRERLGSTGLAEGVAIPHGKLKGLPRLIGSFGRSTAGVDFDALDKKPTKLFFVILRPRPRAVTTCGRSPRQPPLPQRPVSRARDGCPRRGGDLRLDRGGGRKVLTPWVASEVVCSR